MLLRRKKHNFGPLAEPHAADLTFAHDVVTVRPHELGSADLATKSTLNAEDRVRFALENGPMFPSEVAETTGLARQTAKNTLTTLKEEGVYAHGRGEQRGHKSGVPGLPRLESHDIRIRIIEQLVYIHGQGPPTPSEAFNEVPSHGTRISHERRCRPEHGHVLVRFERLHCAVGGAVIQRVCA